MKNTFTQMNWCCFAAFIFFAFLFSEIAKAQVSLTSDMSGYSQNFDQLPSTASSVWESGSFYLPGWTLNRTYTAVNSLLIGTGTSNAGGMYSFGQSGSTDRALGAISSTISKNLSQFAWGFLIQNNTGSTITSLTINFTGEQWRSGSTTAGRQATTFWHSQSATSPTFDLSSKSDVNWTNIPELNFSSIVNYSTAGQLNGNLPANKTFLIATIQVNIPNGHYFMLRWKDLNDLDDDHGLAIDDFALAWSSSNETGPIVMPVEFLFFRASSEADHVKLNWATASEKNSSYFNVEKSPNGVTFDAIGAVSSKGFSSQKVNYTFHDTHPIAGTVYYRLKQVDLDGTYTYSNITSVKRKGPVAVALYPTVTTGEIRIELPLSSTTTKLQVFDKIGRLVLSGTVPAQFTNYKLNIEQLRPGNYFVMLLDGVDQRQVFKVIRK